MSATAATDPPHVCCRENEHFPLSILGLSLRVSDPSFLTLASLMYVTEVSTE